LKNPEKRLQAPPSLWQSLRPLVREKRGKPTVAEEQLWQALRPRRTTRFKFRRQHAIDRFIVDFYCVRARLVVEVDGPIYQRSREADAERQAHLESLGVKVLRFTNDQVLEEMPMVMALIEEACAGG